MIAVKKHCKLMLIMAVKRFIVQASEASLAPIYAKNINHNIFADKQIVKKL